MTVESQTEWRDGRPGRVGCRVFALAFLTTQFEGCAPRGAPSLVLFGAYFPAWMLIALLGILVAVLARVALLAMKLDRLPFQLPACLAIGLTAAVALWMMWFARLSPWAARTPMWSKPCNKLRPTAR